jgi:hypothetical protein
MGETLDWRDGTLGIEDPVRLRLDKLANLLRDVGEVAAAKALYEQAIEGQTVYRGAHHIDTLTSKGNLAVLLRDVGEVAAARALYEEVIAGQTAQSGAEHIDTLTTKGNLAVLLGSFAGDFATARALYEEVIAGQTAQLGADHTATLIFKMHLFNMVCWEKNAPYEVTSSLYDDLVLDLDLDERGARGCFNPADLEAGRVDLDGAWGTQLSLKVSSLTIGSHHDGKLFWWQARNYYVVVNDWIDKLIEVHQRDAYQPLLPCPHSGVFTSRASLWRYGVVGVESR